MTDTPSSRNVEILLVEDDRADVELTRRALTRSKLANALHVAPDGVDALAFLRRQGDHASAPRPDLVLLDLGLPRKDGREVLAEMKSDPELRRIPVVVITSSSDEDAIAEAYSLHANCCITKPVRLDAFVEVVRRIEGFWLAIVTLPPREV
jgi:CheY-like chemotaxis protein